MRGEVVDKEGGIHPKTEALVLIRRVGQSRPAHQCASDAGGIVAQPEDRVQRPSSVFLRFQVCRLEE